MVKIFGLICLFMVLLVTPCITYEGNVVHAIKTSSLPVIDGKLDDVCWQGRKPIGDFILMYTNDTAEVQTEAKVLYDDNNLYIGMKCLEPNIHDIKASCGENHGQSDQSLFKDDCIEIMLDTTLSKFDYFHFAINARGAKFDRLCSYDGHVGDDNWNGDWKTKSFVGETFWSVEVSIPFKTLGISSPKTGVTWGINLCREKKNPDENSSIAEEGMFNLAEKFTTLEFK